MNPKLRKYQLVIIMSLILLLMVWSKIKWGNQSTNSNNIPTISTTPTQELSKVDDEYELWNKLPYRGKGFTIEKYIDKKTLQISIKGIDKKIAENEIYEWLNKNNVATESYKLIIK